MEKCFCYDEGTKNEIKEFNSIFHYERFQRLIDWFVKKGLINELGFKQTWFWERHFECPICKEVWILSEPDFTYKGYWGKKVWFNSES
jgi:hypothetical protein